MPRKKAVANKEKKEEEGNKEEIEKKSALPKDLWGKIDEGQEIYEKGRRKKWRRKRKFKNLKKIILHLLHCAKIIIMTRKKW
jgi:hypothetical protein